MGKQETLETHLMKCLDELWERVGDLSSWRKTRPRPGARKRADPRADARTASSSGCAADANGTDCRKSLGTTAPFIAPFNGGWRRVSCTECGEPLWTRCAELDGVDWEWQSADGAMGKSTFWGDLIGPNPTDRGKAGSQAESPCGWRGRPLEHCWLRDANVHDAKLLEATLDAIVVERPQPTEEEPQHLCLDKEVSILQAVGLPPDTAIGSTSDASVRRSWTPLATSGIRRAGGLWKQDAGMALQVPCGPGPIRHRRYGQLPTECYSSHVNAPVVPPTDGV